MPPASTYSADSSHSWIVVAMPRLSSTGLRVSADAPQQREVLHVARADLKDVGVLGDELDLVGSITSVIDREPGFPPGLGQQLQPLVLEPLERVGRGARLEGAAAQHARAGRLHPHGDVA